MFLLRICLRIFTEMHSHPFTVWNHVNFKTAFYVFYKHMSCWSMTFTSWFYFYQWWENWWHVWIFLYTKSSERVSSQRILPSLADQGFHFSKQLKNSFWPEWSNWRGSRFVVPKKKSVTFAEQLWQTHCGLKNLESISWRNHSVNCCGSTIQSPLKLTISIRLSSLIVSSTVFCPTPPSCWTL